MDSAANFSLVRTSCRRVLSLTYRGFATARIATRCCKVSIKTAHWGHFGCEKLRSETNTLASARLSLSLKILPKFWRSKGLLEMICLCGKVLLVLPLGCIIVECITIGLQYKYVITYTHTQYTQYTYLSSHDWNLLSWRSVKPWPNCGLTRPVTLLNRSESTSKNRGPL